MNIIAINIPPKIPFKKIVKTLNYPYIRSSSAEVIYKIEDQSFIFLYALGAYVLVNVTPAAAKEFKEKLLSLVPDIELEIKQELYEETYQLLINKKKKISVTDSDITIPALKIEYLRIISLVLAESVEPSNRAGPPVGSAMGLASLRAGAGGIRTVLVSAFTGGVAVWPER